MARSLLIPSLDASTVPLLVFGLLLAALPRFVLGCEFSIVWEMVEGNHEKGARTGSPLAEAGSEILAGQRVGMIWEDSLAWEVRNSMEEHGWTKQQSCVHFTFASSSGGNRPGERTTLCLARSSSTSEYGTRNIADAESLVDWKDIAGLEARES
ncbi:hypothetical protein BD410DRAFT_805914 [Rickenella mellea]|uniref:Uncharacterized protein n=1 Tax=Rickenella mellea TaxID=50990 RepID=A0A4Y7PVA2_9AGAM|nr:hypothetical protein BD410DRAFT_805914 [Rickenella mellea]